MKILNHLRRIKVLSELLLSQRAQEIIVSQLVKEGHSKSGERLGDAINLQPAESFKFFHRCTEQDHFICQHFQWDCTLFHRQTPKRCDVWSPTGDGKTFLSASPLVSLPPPQSASHPLGPQGCG